MSQKEKKGKRGVCEEEGCNEKGPFTAKQHKRCSEHRFYCDEGCMQKGERRLAKYLGVGKRITRDGKGKNLCGHCYKKGIKVFYPELCCNNPSCRNLTDEGFKICESCRRYSNGFQARKNDYGKKIYASMKQETEVTTVMRREYFALPTEKAKRKYCNEFAGKLMRRNCYLDGAPPPENGNGIDREDNNLRYIFSNCRSCCGSCNTGKNDYELKNFLIKCFNVTKKQKEKYKCTYDESGFITSITSRLCVEEKNDDTSEELEIQGCGIENTDDEQNSPPSSDEVNREVEAQARAQSEVDPNAQPPSPLANEPSISEEMEKSPSKEEDAYPKHPGK